MSLVRKIVSGSKIATIHTSNCPGGFEVASWHGDKRIDPIEEYFVKHFDDAVTMADQLLGENRYDPKEDL